MGSENISTYTTSRRYDGIGRRNDNDDIPATIFAGRSRRTRTAEVDDVTTTPTNTGSTNETTNTGSVPPAAANPVDNDKPKGVDQETRVLMRETLQMIENQIEKYKELQGKEDNSLLKPGLTKKLTFWKHAKAMELKIQNRLKKYGVEDTEAQKTRFKNKYEVRSKMLVNKMQQGVYADNKSEFYGRLNQFDSILTQLATGSSFKQLEANSELTKTFAGKVEDAKAKLDEIDAQIKEISKNLKKAKTQEARDELKAKMKEAREEQETKRNYYTAFYTASLRFGGRAKSFTDIDRAQYEKFITDAEKFDGDISVNFLP